MRNLDAYLEQIQNNESIFPMDSYHTGVPRKSVKRIYMDEDGNIVERERLLIDFDGTIHKYSNGWADGTIYDIPNDGAKEAIDTLKDRYEIVIFSTRASCKENKDCQQQIMSMRKWLGRHDIHYDDITSEKIGAFKIVDDLAITFKSWSQVLKDIKSAEGEK